MSNWKYWYTESESRRACGFQDAREWQRVIHAGEIPPPTNIDGARLRHVCDLADFMRKHPERLRSDQRPPRHEPSPASITDAQGMLLSIKGHLPATGRSAQVAQRALSDAIRALEGLRAARVESAA